MRKEFLKAYLFALFSEGAVDINAPGAVAKVMAVIAGDVPVVLGELLGQYAEATGNKIGAAVIGAFTGKLQDIADELRTKGPKAAAERLKKTWAGVQKTYWAGADAGKKR